jgi:AraC family transcriptional regulator of adaptative response/methylated-DNA-[protein]-cysteine methyltransferase
MTPAAYRRGGAGVRIRHATVATPVGRLLVAATDRGVCSIAFGDDARSLRDGLRREFPNATLVDGDERLTTWVATIVSALTRGEDPSAVPLDVQGSAFQWRVWKALRAIPRGETRSYAEVAAAIGAPRAARAVASACASNQAALVIPCHRVVRGDGSSGGYRWGEERKRGILAAERVASERSAAGRRGVRPREGRSPRQ